MEETYEEDKVLYLKASSLLKRYRENKSNSNPTYIGYLDGFPKEEDIIVVAELLNDMLYEENVDVNYYDDGVSYTFIFDSKKNNRNR